MKVPFSWLKDYVDIDVTAQELADKLFSCGFEVEELIYLGEKIDRVVVGEVKALTPHPDSDHMQVCVVDCGEEYGRELEVFSGLKGNVAMAESHAGDIFCGRERLC